MRIIGLIIIALLASIEASAQEQPHTQDSHGW
jgi:hypothetical protein